MRADAAAVWLREWNAVRPACECTEVPTPKQRPPPSPEDPLALPRLRDYQRIGARFLLEERECILADAMGLGKTSQLIAAAWASARPHVVVIAPAYVLGVWESELAKWWPEQAGVWRAQGTKTLTLRARGAKKGAALVGPPPAGVLLCSYESLHAWAGTFVALPEPCFIFDEAHYLASGRARRTQAAQKASAGARYRWGATGTPLTNRPRDLHAVVETIRPGTFGDFFRYGVRYCGGHKAEIPTVPPRTVWNFDGASRPEELRERLGYFMLRRTLADVALELPPKTRQVVRVTPAAAPGTRRVGALEGRDFNPIALRSALAAAADTKLPIVAERAIEAAEAGSNVVVFCYRRAVAEAVANQCHAAGIYAAAAHGGLTVDKRAATIAACRDARETGSVLACTIDSCGTGVDLSYADLGIFAELTYEPHELLQAEARLHRYGARRPILIQYVIAEGTADDLVAQVVVARLDQFEAIVGSTGEVLAGDLAGKEEDIMAALMAAVEGQKEGVK